VRSLSAVTWCLAARTERGSNWRITMFAEDSARGFDAIFGSAAWPEERPPSILRAGPRRGGRVRARLDRTLAGAHQRASRWRQRTTGRGGRCRSVCARLWPDAGLRGCGIEAHGDPVAATPSGFDVQLFPATGGALYGRANHGMMGELCPRRSARQGAGALSGGRQCPPGSRRPRWPPCQGRIAAAPPAGGLDWRLRPGTGRSRSRSAAHFRAAG